jgi:hypothetical protein
MQEQQQSTTHLPRTRLPAFLINPSRPVEIAVWVLLVGSIVAIRLYLIHQLPVVLWSKDAGTYAYSAFAWVHSGIWETDPRRGPMYSLLIAGCAKLTGDLDSLMIGQHVLGGFSVLLAIVALRVLYGRAAIIPIGLCGYAYAVYGLPLYLEHLVRQETLLFFFGSVALATWLIAIKRDAPHWLWASGIAAGLLMLTKNVFGPFPLVVIAGHLWYYRSTLKTAAKHVVIFCAAFALPIAGAKVHKQLTLHRRPPEPQAGILLYGRTAQFTDLEGGIEPEIKREIAAEVQDYRRFIAPKKPGGPPRLNNNLILKQTVVPHLRRILAAQHKTPADVNKLCMALAVEAIKKNKTEYARQVVRDLDQIHFKGGYKSGSPKPSDLKSVAQMLRGYEKQDPLMQVERTVEVLDARLGRKTFSAYQYWTNSAWLFRFVPVLLTSLILPVFVFATRTKIQLWWIGAAAVWFFTMVLLSTIGRPDDRYLISAVPVMFWTLSAAVIYLWQLGIDWCVRRR